MERVGTGQRQTRVGGTAWHVLQAYWTTLRIFGTPSALIFGVHWYG